MILHRVVDSIFPATRQADISPRRFAGTIATEAFFAELVTISHQIGSITHEFRDGTRQVLGYVQLHRSGGEVTIHRIWTNHPLRGHGSTILKTLCELADRHGVLIRLKVAPLGNKPYPLSAENLRQWYHRHGFAGETKMVRMPALSMLQER